MRGTDPGRALRRLPLLLALLALAGCAGEARRQEEPRPPVSAEAAVDRATATTGDLVTYTVTVEHDPALEVEIPAPGAEIGGLAVVETGREGPRRAAGRVTQRRWARLRADLVGSYVLPPVEVRFRPAAGSGEGGEEAAAPAPGAPPGGSVTTSEVFVEVESVLPADGSATDIRDVKPLRRLDDGPPWLSIAAALLLAAAAAIAVLLLRRRRRRGRPAAPPVPAHEQALAALAELWPPPFEDREAVRRYHFRVSEVVRTYVERRFRLNATDLTTEEILPRLAGLDLPPGEARRLARFLADSDRVKFAGHLPRPDEVRETHERARAFVEATRPAPEPPAAGEAREAAA